MTADALRDRIAQAIESVTHDPGGRPCELCLETADAVLAVLADADPTDLGYERTRTAWLTVPGVCNHGSWDHCPRTDHEVRPFYTRPRPEETTVIRSGSEETP